MPLTIYKARLFRPYCPPFTMGTPAGGVALVFLPCVRVQSSGSRPLKPDDRRLALRAFLPLVLAVDAAGGGGSMVRGTSAALLIRAGAGCSTGPINSSVSSAAAPPRRRGSTRKFTLMWLLFCTYTTLPRRS